MSKYMTYTELIVILGNSDPVIYNARASHAVRVFLNKIKLNKNIYLLPKFYKHSWTLETFEIALNKYKGHILLDSISEYYRRQSDTHDTINEALATRFILENKYPDLDVVLTVVTSKCHETRSRWIFENVFKDLYNIKLEFSSSNITFNEIKLNREEVEKRGLQDQYKMITNEGGMYNFINNRFLNNTYTAYFFEKNVEPVDPTLPYDDNYKLIYKHHK